MYKKYKSYYVKPNIDLCHLTKYGFTQYGNNYDKDIKGSKFIRCYYNTRRIVYNTLIYKRVSYRYVKRHIKDLIKDKIVDLVDNYHYIGKVKDRNKEKIDNKLYELNKVVYEKYGCFDVSGEQNGKE